MILVIGITGASGVIYGIRLLEVLKHIESVQTHLIVTESGVKNIEYETTWSIQQVCDLADCCYDVNDKGASLASGSFYRDGMIIAPCTVKTLSAVANSFTANLLVRCADVTLKERKKLVLMFRETPLHVGHIENMRRATAMGAVVLPPMPAFYHQPQTIEDIIDHTIGKVLDLFNIEHSLYRRWEGDTG